MPNKTLAIINLLCILAPVILGVIEELTGSVLTTGLLIGVLGLLMIIFGIWTSLRLAKQPD
jgi:hypothetical protein